MDKVRRRKVVVLGLLVVSFLVSFAGLAYPIYVIRPFRYQGPRELAAALIVTRARPGIELVCCLLAFAGLLLYWRAQTHLAKRVVAAAGTFAVCVFAVLSEVNVYELMFHPDTHPLFAAAQQVKIDPDDKVLAVKLEGSARAYPIRTMGYHHIINDVVGGEPIVATY